MIWKSGKGDGGEDGRFALKCDDCGMVYMQVVLNPDQTYQYSLPSPQVPCHADGLRVSAVDMSPWSRISRLFGLDKKRSGKFEYTLTMQDGMIYAVSIRREG